MREEAFHDDMLFDRLVDGELSEAERRHLLESLDERPDGWRRCALAFLEAQAWSSDLGNAVREPMPSQEPIGRATPASAHRKPLQQGLAWLAIAASVLVAVTLTLMRGDFGRSIVRDAPDAKQPIAEAPPPSAQGLPDTQRADDALTFWVRDDTGQTRPLRVPLVDAGALDRELGVRFQSAIPSSIRERLQERGYDVQSKRRYAPLWLENGRPMIVPVEDTKIVPVSQKVY